MLLLFRESRSAFFLARCIHVVYAKVFQQAPHRWIVEEPGKAGDIYGRGGRVNFYLSQGDLIIDAIITV